MTKDRKALIHMCTKITCNSCGRPTWQGCGEHIEQALHDVAVPDRCDCPGSEAPPARPHGHGFGGTSAGSW